MRYQYTFEKNIKENVLNVYEAGEIENNFVVMYEGTYALDEIQDASEKGAKEFILKLRKKNFFPDSLVAAKLYETTSEFFSNKSEEKIVINYADIETLPTEEIEEEEIEADVILSDDDDTSENAIKEIDSEDDTPRFMPEDISELED